MQNANFPVIFLFYLHPVPAWFRLWEGLMNMCPPFHQILRLSLFHLQNFLVRYFQNFLPLIFFLLIDFGCCPEPMS